MKEQLKKNAQKVLDRLIHLGVKDFEVFIEAKQGTNLELKDGQRDAFEIKNGLGFGLRVIKDNRMTFSYGLDFSKLAIDFVVKNCLESLPHYPADSCVSFVQAQKYADYLELRDQNFESISYDQKIDFLKHSGNGVWIYIQI